MNAKCSKGTKNNETSMTWFMSIEYFLDSAINTLSKFTVKSTYFIDQETKVEGLQ